MSRVPPHAEIATQRPDWLAEDPVGIAPVSAAKFPLSGQKTGKSTDLMLYLALLDTGIEPPIQWFEGTFPSTPKREFTLSMTGISFGWTGLHSLDPVAAVERNAKRSPVYAC
jgi:hypothetical protein